MKRKPEKRNSLLEDIRPLVQEIQRIKKQAEALGLFMDDRELLECANCGLMEDVTFENRLITYYRGSEDLSDCGLRFDKVGDDIFRCPVCGTELKAVFL